MSFRYPKASNISTRFLAQLDTMLPGSRKALVAILWLVCSTTTGTTFWINVCFHCKSLDLFCWYKGANCARSFHASLLPEASSGRCSETWRGFSRPTMVQTVFSHIPLSRVHHWDVDSINSLHARTFPVAATGSGEFTALRNTMLVWARNTLQAIIRRFFRLVLGDAAVCHMCSYWCMSAAGWLMRCRLFL